MTGSSSLSDQRQRPVIDTSVAHAARVWNYWLGGKDNYPIDHEFGQRVREVMPDILDIARADRGFWSARSGTWRGRRGSTSSSTSAPGCPP